MTNAEQLATAGGPPPPLHPGAISARPWRSRAFWVTQLLVLAVLGAHFAANSLYRAKELSIPPFVIVILAILPVGYAALRFGLRGSVPTALWVTILLLPNLLLLDSGVLRWADATMLALLIAISVAAGRLVDRQQASTQRQVEAARLGGVARVADQLRDGICVTDAAGVITYTNPAWAQLQGLGAEEVTVGRTLTSFHAPGGRGRVPLPFEAPLPSDGHARQVVTHHFQDGRQFWAEVDTTELVNDRQEVVGRLSTVRDVTHDKEEAAALEAAEERFRRIFERAPLGMATITLEGRFIQVNQALGRMLGRPAAELAGQDLLELTAAEDRGRTREVLDERQAEAQFVKRYLHRDGHLVWLQATATLMRHPDGEPWYFIGQYQDVTKERRQRERLIRQAFHDPLTGLPNRLLLEDRLAQALTRTRRQRHRVAVLFCDLDGFKAVNDRLGHHAGDLVLSEVAERLKRSVREVDTVARLGGDEFVVLLDGLTGPAQATATRIRDAVRQPYRLDEETVPIRVSIGIATSSGSESTAEALLQQADSAMYLAKMAGGDGFQEADSGAAPGPAHARGGGPRDRHQGAAPPGKRPRRAVPTR